MRRLNGQPLRKIPASEAQALAENPGTTLVRDAATRAVYELQDGRGLTVFRAPHPKADPETERTVVKGEIWPTPWDALVSLRAAQRRVRTSTHVLAGVFDAPDLILAGLADQRRILREELGLAEDPPLTSTGLAEYDRRLPRERDGYDARLIRAAACVLTEAVRIEVRGTYQIERASQSPDVWEPWIRPEGGGERLLPAAEFLKALNEEAKPPRLRDLYRAETGDL